jgi:hypothetical protein
MSESIEIERLEAKVYNLQTRLAFQMEAIESLRNERNRLIQDIERYVTEIVALHRYTNYSLVKDKE